MRSPLRFARPGGDYGMLGVLALLCVLFSLLTLREQEPSGARAARAVLGLLSGGGNQAPVLLITGAEREDGLFASTLETGLRSRGIRLAGVIRGDPAEVRMRLAARGDSSFQSVTLVATRLVAPVAAAVTGASVITPPTYRWPTFLLAENLRNVANQITVIAILAIGMTLVIISGGIDLSVGSLIALSAVTTAWLISHLGGEAASVAAMCAASLGGILVAGLIGAFSGLMITRFRVPPFIATLAMMQVAAGLAYIASRGKPIYQVPGSFTWLGRGMDPLLRVPHAVVLMAALFALAHLVMTRTVAGRSIYAVGGNREAARLAGIRVDLVLFIVYVISGLLAGLGGVLAASQLRSGAPTYGASYELYVIAAVVVGGATLSGGEGRVLGTLVGALVIAVIQNGMNLANVESYTQKVVLGLVILGAVLLDRLKHARGRGPGRGTP